MPVFDGKEAGYRVVLLDLGPAFSPKAKCHELLPRSVLGLWLEVQPDPGPDKVARTGSHVHEFNRQETSGDFEKTHLYAYIFFLFRN